MNPAFIRPLKTRAVGIKVYFELRPSRAESANTAGARARTASSDNPRSNALACAEKERLAMVFMIASLRNDLGRDCPLREHRGARSGQGSKTAAGGEGVPPSSLTASTAR